MKVLYSSQSLVEFDGKHYYGNSINATYRRYQVLGDELTIICHLKNVKEPTNDIIEDGSVTFVNIKKVNSVHALLQRYYRYNDKVAEEQVRKADVIVVHLPSDNGYQVIKYARRYNKPYMTVVCGCPWDVYTNYDWRGRIVAPWQYYELRQAQKYAPYSIYVTNRFLQKRYPTTGKSIGCSNVNIVTGEEGVLERRLSTIKEHVCSGKPLKIGTAGAIDVSYKGQEYVIRALAELKKEGRLFEYHLIGKGDPGRLKEIAQQCGVEELVFFRGSLPHQEVLGFYDSLDIYVHPSKTEGLPRALVEAESRGCLCLGSDAGGITELLEPGYLFPATNVTQIVNILREISQQALEQQAKRNYEFAKDFDKSVLNERRKNFILEFKNSIK